MLPRFINFLRTRRALAVANDATSARVRTTRIPKTPCCNGRGTTLYWIDSSGKHLRSDGRSLSQPLQAPAPSTPRMGSGSPPIRRHALVARWSLQPSISR